MSVPESLTLVAIADPRAKAERLIPTPTTARIKAYSAAVAPAWSLRKRHVTFVIVGSPRQHLRMIRRYTQAINRFHSDYWKLLGKFSSNALAACLGISRVARFQGVTDPSILSEHFSAKRRRMRSEIGGLAFLQAHIFGIKPNLDGKHR